jgi:hypothetical protein
MTNKWLYGQGLISVKEQWVNIHYLAIRPGNLDEPPYADPLVGWCGGWGRKTPGYPILARPARRDKVLDEVSAAIPGDASRREHEHLRLVRRMFLLGLYLLNVSFRGQKYWYKIVLSIDFHFFL